jgi:hypothetical protein
MTNVGKHNDHHHQQQSNTLTDHHISSLIDQIYEQLVCTVLFDYVGNILGITNNLQREFG